MTQPILDKMLVEFTGHLPEFLEKLTLLTFGYPKLRPKEGDPWWETSEPFQLVDELVQRLNQRAPYGYVFGPHPNAPSCFGFWANS